MNFEEQNKELRRLKLYLMQINRCITSKSRRVTAAWQMDKDFELHIISVLNLIETERQSVELLRSCKNDGFGILSETDRSRLLNLASRIRELDEQTEQELFIDSDRIKKKQIFI